jgi:hypothetical protein
LSFENEFKIWLLKGLREPIASEVEAFCFNLVEYAETSEYKFGIELIGASDFDEDSFDWACDEVWEPTTRSIVIPKNFSGSRWQECLTNTKTLVQNCLDTLQEASILKSKQGVGIGFVDGDLEVVWQPTSP